MKNILLLSTIYPLPSKENLGTKVCHYFVQDWMTMGYNVRVVHYQAVFPFFYYWPVKLFHKLIESRTGAVFYKSPDKKIIEYTLDGVSVMRIPLFKAIPHGKHPMKAINISVKVICDYCEENDFVPDVILGHFSNPILDVVVKLKGVYPNAKAAIIMHGDNRSLPRIYGDRLSELMKHINCWGFRSKSIREDFEKYVGKVDKSFICYSGVPETYITKENKHMFTHSKPKFIYVGSMIKRKYPTALLYALHEVYPDGNFELSYVGAGGEATQIKKITAQLGIKEQVRILGKVQREKIAELYDQSDYMIMISESEAYGLVYLEAMSRGCITIASRNEGFDGVIKDGLNGFLCKAGDWKELAAIIQKVESMTTEEKIKLSTNAIETAKRLTDQNAAQMYIDNVLTLSK